MYPDRDGWDEAGTRNAVPYEGGSLKAEQELCPPLYDVVRDSICRDRWVLFIVAFMN